MRLRLYNAVRILLHEVHLETPRIEVCEIDPEYRLWIGCGRSLGEMGLRSGYDDAQLRRIMASQAQLKARYYPSLQR